MPERLGQTTDPDLPSGRLRFELIFASAWIAVGLFLVPAVIFWVGIALLGTYGEAPGAGLGTFYADFFGDLATGEVRTWLLALSPLILVSLVRTIFLDVRGPTEDEPTRPAMTPPAASLKGSDSRRVEPKVGD